MTSPALPDAAPSNWVDRWAPERLRPWLRLGRFDRPVGIWLLMLPGWWGVALASALGGRWPDPRLLLLFFIGAAAMRAAGCAYNDIVDRDLDRKVARTAGRPVASGRITPGAAGVYVVGLSLLGLMVLLQLNRLAMVIAMASLALVAAYPFMKRITWWPQAWLGLTFNWGVLVGAAAAGGGVPFRDTDWADGVTGFSTGSPAIGLYLSGVFWTLGYDTIYALQDLEDDALAGVKSSARRLGRDVRRAVGGFYAIAFLGALLAGWSIGLRASLLVLILFGLHLAWQVWRLDPDDPRSALRLFKSNTWAGLILFAALALGAGRP